MSDTYLPAAALSFKSKSLVSIYLLKVNNKSPRTWLKTWFKVNRNTRTTSQIRWNPEFGCQDFTVWQKKVMPEKNQGLRPRGGGRWK